MPLMSIGFAFATQALLLVPLLFIHGLAESEASTAPMAKAERDTLYSVIQGFVGNSWNGPELYPDPCGWTPIQGISCDLFDGLWYVTVMSIGPVLDNSLDCSPDAQLSSHLFELRHLKSLSFFNCFTSSRNAKTISSQNWDALAGSLEALEFRSNQGLVGEIPTSFGKLIGLKSLVLVDNALTGEFPRELGMLVHLNRLALGGNHLSGQIPASFGYNMTELLILDLSGNSLNGPIPSSLGGMSSLLKLDLSSNRLNGMLPIELGRLRSLTLLDLRNNNLTGGLAQSLQGMESIQDMLLSNNPIGGTIMDFGWENLSNLTTLDLANTGLSGGIPESITRLRRLRFLGLDKNHLSGNVPPKLAALPNLTALHLNGNNLTGELAFSEEFYERMGRRFASWNNANLCYTSGVMHSPFGVEQCKDEQAVSFYGSNPEKQDKNSSFKASFGASASYMSGLWWAVMQELVIVGLLVALL